MKTCISVVLAALGVGGLGCARANLAGSHGGPWKEQRVGYAPGKSAWVQIPQDFTEESSKVNDGARYRNAAGDSLMLAFEPNDASGAAAGMLKTIHTFKDSKSMKVGPYTIDEKAGDLPQVEAKFYFGVIIPSTKKGMCAIMVLSTKKPWSEVGPEFESIATWIALHNNPM